MPARVTAENLRLGGYTASKAQFDETLARVEEMFPILHQKREAMAGSLSGGQQQMVAIGRALMVNPRVLLCDEISLGLSPAVIRDVYAALAEIKRRGTTVILVEQDLGAALRAADRVYCFMEGRVRLSGRPSELTRDAIHAAYFGS